MYKIKKILKRYKVLVALLIANIAILFIYPDI